jgi:nucleoside-diphosphate-sugar epimerase
MRVCVTGASGTAGREAARHLREHGYDVLATDVRVSRADREDILEADLTDHGQAVDVLHGIDAAVHLANIPAPGLAPAALTFNANTTMNFNVFHAAVHCGLRRVVWASSETTLGLPFDVPPRYAPVDEAHFPYPTSTYALSKVVSETIAAQLADWSGIPFLGLRFSNIFAREDYALVPSFWDDATLRRWNLWGYIDVRDAAAACRLALEAPVEGADHFIIAAPDTVMDRPSADLMREVYPGVPLTRELVGHETLLAIDHARDILGFEPQHSWRQQLADGDARAARATGA